jgi:ParB-like nuclease domain
VRHCGELLELDDVRRRLRPSGESHLGMRSIEIDRIVGTLDRCCDFDRCFHPMRPDLAVRVSGVAGAFPDGAFPPIDVVQVDQAYFVVDGHKRVAAARRSGVEVIDANVTRLAVAHSVDAATERDDLLLAEAEDRFLGDSGLREARPGVRVSCLSPRAYAELLEAVKAHGHDLMRASERLLPAGEVAAHWHDCDYLPSAAAAREHGIADLLTCCPAGELYLVLHRLAWTSAGADCEALQANAQGAAADIEPPPPRRRRWPRATRA